LVLPRTVRVVALAAVLDEFFEVLDVKPITRLGYQATKNDLLRDFGKDRDISTITFHDAEQWRAKLKDRKLAEATISKRVRLARQIFARAVRWGYVEANPFLGVKAGSQQNAARMWFVTRADADKVLAACPDAEWRLVVGLSRFGGLRCPSEHRALKWSDIDWDQDRIRVPSSKTERYDGRAFRWIPMFPELRSLLQDVYDRAPVGGPDQVLSSLGSHTNLSTQLRRIIGRAGLNPWPRLFHNLRSTRQTELAGKHPLHVVCAWLGNTKAVAAGHYLQVTDDDFVRAVGKAAHNPAQHVHEMARTGLQGENALNAEVDSVQGVATGCENLQIEQVAATGLEPVTRGL